MSNKTIAVSGASGHLGYHVVLKLIEQGYKVRAQFKTSRPDINHDLITWLQGDITDADDVKKLLEECDVIIHCAAIVTLSRTQRSEVLETNVLGTQNIVDHCAMSSANIRMIHISSTSVVNPKPINEISDETRPYLNVSDYAYSWSKSMAEQSVAEAVKNQKLDAIILRPSALFGPPDLKPSLFGDFAFKFMNNKFPVITSGGYNMIDVRDAAQTVVNSIEMGKTGEIYNVGGEYQTLHQLTQIISKFSGSNLPKIILSVSLTIWLSPIISAIFRARKMNSPFTKENMFFVKNGAKHLSSCKAQKELNHQCRATNETMKDLVEFFNNSNANQ